METGEKDLEKFRPAEKKDVKNGAWFVVQVHRGPSFFWLCDFVLYAFWLPLHAHLSRLCPLVSTQVSTTMLWGWCSHATSQYVPKARESAKVLYFPFIVQNWP